MTPKMMSFYTTVWFLSVLICMVLEGSYLGTYHNSILDDLMLFTWQNVFGLFSIPILNIYFFRGLYRILIWDYSFYQGGYTILRYTWACILTPGAAWGIGSVLAPVAASLLSAFKGLIPIT